MKKEFVYLSKVMTAAVFTALSLTSCSEDIVGNDDDNATGGKPGVAVFSNGVQDNASRVGLKTTMNETGTFYWSAGDYIFVKNGDYIKSDNAASSKLERENFYLQGVFDAASYPVVYTGNGDATTATSVTVKANQTQATANDATHIGTDGDCGNAIATRTDLYSYRFDLMHRASYLVITPRHALNGEVKFDKVVVTTSGSDNLCGTYTFSENTTSLKNETATATGKSVTLDVDNWTVPTVESVNASQTAFDGVRGFMVIQPGTHTLTFTYHVTVNGTARQFEKVVSSREFASGNYTNVKHILADGMFNGGHVGAGSSGEITDDPLNWDFTHGFTYAQWGSGNEYLPYSGNKDYDATTQIPTQLSSAPWSDLPNANELYWYIVNGDPRWDATSVWSSDGGITEHTGGIWLMKKSAILAAGKTFDSTKGKADGDMRVINRTHSNSSTTYRFAGKPSDSELSNYFFLPALGYYNSGSLITVGNSVAYWSSSGWPVNNTLNAYYLNANYQSVYLSCQLRHIGNVVAPGWFR